MPSSFTRRDGTRFFRGAASNPGVKTYALVSLDDPAILGVKTF